jgi:hypothetical protein
MTALPPIHESQYIQVPLGHIYLTLTRCMSQFEQVVVLGCKTILRVRLRLNLASTTAASLSCSNDHQLALDAATESPALAIENGDTELPPPASTPPPIANANNVCDSPVLAVTDAAAAQPIPTPTPTATPTPPTTTTAVRTFTPLHSSLAPARERRASHHLAVPGSPPLPPHNMHTHRNGIARHEFTSSGDRFQRAPGGPCVGTAAGAAVAGGGGFMNTTFDPFKVLRPSSPMSDGIFDGTEDRAPPTSAQEFIKIIRNATTKKDDEFFAFQRLCHSASSSSIDGWDIFSWSSEFARLEIPDLSWRITRVNEESFALCATYPEQMIVPTLMDDTGMAEHMTCSLHVFLLTLANVAWMQICLALLNIEAWGAFLYCPGIARNQVLQSPAVPSRL